MNLALNDDLQIIFLNTKGRNDEEVESELPAFLKFVENSCVVTEEQAKDERLRELYEKIQLLKNRADMEADYMKMEERYQQLRDEGKKERFGDQSGSFFYIGKKRGYLREGNFTFHAL